MPRTDKGRKEKGSKKNSRSSPRGSKLDLPVRLPVTSDSDEMSETASVFSVEPTENDIPEESSDTETGEVDQEVVSQDDFESKLKECIELLLQKSANGRVNAMKSLSTAFKKRLCTEFLCEQKVTIADALERGVKKGRGEEQAAAAHCAAVLIVQLGLTSDVEEAFSALKDTLYTVFQNQATSPNARAEIALCLGLGTFIASEEVEDIERALTALEAAFSASFLKGNSVAPVHEPPVAAMHAAALQAWSLLLTICPPHTVQELVDKNLTKLTGMLQSNDVELRIVAGEVIALCYELARDQDEEFEGSDEEELCVQLKQLATDSVKHRAKKDRRQQRSAFRDIYRALENGESPDMQIKFGSECLVVDTWATKRQYDSFRQALTSGLNLHLTENLLLRDLFQLGPVLCATDIKARVQSRADRHQWNSAAFKERTKIRGKARDKRVATYSF